MIVGAISDMHGQLPRITEDVDLLLIAGDICPHARVSALAEWMQTTFSSWLKELVARRIAVIGVAGNHDWVLYKPEADSYRQQVLNALHPYWTYLEDSGAEYGGLRVWGSPWQLKFNDWAFNLENETELKQKWDLIPEDTDVLITHSPPFLYGDQNAGGKATGSKTLLHAIERIQPKLAVYGHIHEGYGVYRVGDSRLANVSVLDNRYQLTNKPMYFEL